MAVFYGRTNKQIIKTVKETMKIKFYKINKEGKLELVKTDTVKSGMKLQFHSGIMEKWCKEIRFEND